ncbi:MAG: hypothetical protein FJY67_09180 [Calditrichaeota bacterium]|nr:hypothetical protein [Calditrichota bacterium]
MARSLTFRLVCLAMAIFTLTLGLPNMAWATDLDLEMLIQWDQEAERYDIEVQVRFLDSGGIPITDWQSMTPNSNYSVYTLNWVDVPANAAIAQFVWTNPDPRLSSDGQDVIDGPDNSDPITAEVAVNWQGVTSNDVFNDWDGN